MSNGTLSMTVTIEATLEASYATHGIPEGDEGALMAAIARDLRACDNDELQDIFYESELKVLTVTKAEEQEAEQG